MLSLALCLALGATDAPKKLAVSYFDVEAQDPELQVLKKGMADMVITDLVPVGGLVIVEREKLNAVLDELKLAQSPYADKAQAVKLGKVLSATHVLTGLILVVKKQMRVSARVVDVETAEVIASREVTGEPDEFFSLEKELVDLLVDSLTLKPTLKEKNALRKNQTESYKAFKSYSMGLDRRDRKDDDGARAAFEEAMKADPGYQAARAALERLGKAIDKVEAGRAKSLDDQLAALKPDDPDLYRTLEKLVSEAPGPDRETVELQVLEFLAKSKLKPRKSRFVPTAELGGSPFEHFEAHRLFQLVSAWGTDPQFLPHSPALIEYLVRKFSDDPTFLMHVRDSLPRFEQAVAKADFSKPPPDFRGLPEYTERPRAHLAFFQRLAAAVPPPPGSRAPADALARARGLLDAEYARRLEEFDREFARRLGALDPKASNKELSAAISDLNLLGQEHHTTYRRPSRVEGAKWQVQVCRWLVEHPEARPYHGTAKDPMYLEESMLLQWVVRFDHDPKSWALIPGVGEYLLKRFPDSKYLPNQLKLHRRSIEEAQQDPRAEQRWAEKLRTECSECAAGDEVRALFKLAAAAAK